MNTTDEKKQNEGSETKKRGLFQRMAGKMMGGMMKMCPCSGIIDGELGEGEGCKELMEKFMSGKAESGYCSEMASACCGEEQDSDESEQQ